MKKKIFLILLLLTSFAIPVRAQTFKVFDDSYAIEDINTSCVTSIIPNAMPVALIEDKILFADSYLEKFVLVSKTGVCETNISMEIANKGREILNYIGVFTIEKDGNNYAAENRYSIATKYFTDKDTNQLIELSHYDLDTIKDDITYYKRIEIDGEQYIEKLDKNEVKEEDILLYYYEKEGEYEIEENIITEITDNMYNFTETFAGWLEPNPKGDRVFAVASDEDDKKMVYSDEGFLIFTSLDDFAYVGDYLFFTITDGVGEIRNDNINVLHTINNLSSVRVIDSNDKYVLIETTDQNNKTNNLLLSKYSIDENTNDIYSGTGDFNIKVTNDINDLTKVTINEEELETNMYDIKSITNTINIKENYLKTLTSGEYNVVLTYKNGIEVELTFIIPAKLKVQLDANEGLFNDNNKIYTYEEFTLDDLNKLPTPTREGYKFKGFYSKKDSTGISIEKYLAYDIDNDITFYAHWDKINSSNNENIKEENPKTFDGISTSIILGIISLIGLIIVTLYSKKEIK